MKIVFVVPRFSPEIGGVENHVKSVTRELVSHGNDVTIITSTCKKSLKPFEITHNLKVHRFFKGNAHSPKVNFLTNLLFSWIFLFNNFSMFTNCDVIHLHDAQSFIWFFPLIPILKIFFRMKIFITFHGFEGYPIPRTAKLIRHVAEKTVDGNVCVGSFIAKWYGTKPDFIIIGAVDSMNSPSLVSYDRKGAIFVGRLAKDTGILQYVEALRILKEEHSISLPLCVCGDGPLRSRIEKLAETHNLDITLLGFIKNPRTLLEKHRYAFVSGYLSILESMSSKTLVFAVYTNPLKKDYLFSIPNAKNLIILSSSPNELAHKLYNAIVNSQETNHLVENAHVFASNLSWSNVEQIYLRLYNLKNVLTID